MDSIYSDCFWLATSGPYEPEPALQGEVRADVAIVGAGFTGLSAAYHLRLAQPAMKVVVLDAEQVGFGASGRNGGFAMTVFGLSVWWSEKRFGAERARQAHLYMEAAVDLVGELITRNNIDCDARRSGFLRAATTPGYLKRIQEDVERVQRWGVQGIEWIGPEALSRRVRSPVYLGAWWEPRCIILNPAKLARGMKRAAQNAGAVLYENTPVLSVERAAEFALRTPGGVVKAERVVFATNAWSHLLPQMRRRQIPAFTYMVATEPLTAAQWQEIGWQNGEGIEDARNLVHYYRPTADGRLVMGGGPVGLTAGRSMERDRDEVAWDHLARHIRTVFPSLKGIKVEYRWGGPFSVAVDLAPALGYLGDSRATYSLGCTGHGVSTCHMNGQVLRDLVLERKTDLTELFFVNRRTLPWPPDPLRMAASGAIRGYLQLEDWAYERGTAVA
jgi:glycine/D-amino acid oxidase-like deaminating enzyme